MADHTFMLTTHTFSTFMYVCMAIGKWNNHFTAAVQISTGNKDALIKDVFAEYLNKGG